MQAEVHCSLQSQLFLTVTMQTEKDFLLFSLNHFETWIPLDMLVLHQQFLFYPALFSTENRCALTRNLLLLSVEGYFLTFNLNFTHRETLITQTLECKP